MTWYEILIIIAACLIVVGVIVYGLRMRLRRLRGLFRLLGVRRARQAGRG